MYNPTYNRDKRGSFVQKNSFASIFAGTDAYFIEDELNEMQWIQNEARASIVRKLVKSSFYTKGTLELNSTQNSNGFVMGKSELIVNGYEVTIANNKNRSDEKNTIILSAPPATGTRKDLVFVEVWFEEVKGSDPVYNYGGVESGVATNSIIDPRLGVETSRRVQIRWRIRVVDNINTTSYPEGINDVTKVFAWGANSANTSITFDKSTTDEGLFVAGTGSPANKTTLKSVDGFVYAVPMFIIDRFNTTAYNASTNPNGAPIYVDASSVSTRPDGKFANVIYTNQVTDKAIKSEAVVLKSFRESDDGSSLTLDKSFVIEGNLTVTGTTTTINTTELNVSDNIVRLNNDFTGATPTESAGIEVERGGLANTSIIWDESVDKWRATNNGSNYYDVLLSDQKGIANGIATLGSDNKVPYTQLPLLSKSTSATVSSNTSAGDYATIQDAIDALPTTGGAIYVREGTYNELITLKSNIVIIGQGYSTVIKMDNGVNSDNLITGSGISNVKIQNIKIDVNKSGQTSGKNIGISLYNTSYIDIDNVYIENAKDYGIHLDTVFSSSIRSNTFKNVTGEAIYNYGDPVSDKDGNEITSNKFENCGTAVNLDVNSSYNLASNNIIRACTSGIINSGTENVVNNNLKR